MLINPTTSTAPKQWLSLSEAALILGVHFTTLRRWADAGEIECIRTPGGRRRFKPEVIDAFVLDHKLVPKTASLAVIDAKLIDHTRIDLRSPGGRSEAWMGQFTPEQKAQFRQTGSRLTALLMRFSHREENGTAFMEEGKRLAENYGALCYQAGLPIDQTIQAFHFFQRSILDALHETGSIDESRSAESRGLYHRAATFFSELLLALVKQYTLLSATHILPNQL